MKAMNHPSTFTRLLIMLALFASLFGFAPSATVRAASGDCVTTDTITTCTYDFTGTAQTWIVPTGVTAATFDVYGAQGGNGVGGKGGRVTATLAVIPGTIYQLNVGSSGGYNGGGGGYQNADGGGGSDVRSGSLTLADRLIVGGGGGGIGYKTNAAGGAGGYPNGGDGGSAAGRGGGGGTQTGGGAGGNLRSSGGSFGQGGETANADGNPSGAGGGGYYGGGKGAIVPYEENGSGGGGGGSSYFTPAATNVSYENGVRNGNGQIIVTYTISPDTTAPVITPTVSGTLGNNEYYTSDVTVTWNVSDRDSAITQTSGCDTQTVTNDTNGVTFTCAATSAGGTISQSVTIKRDATTPTIRFARRTAANAAGWNNGDVTVDWNCIDGTSGTGGAVVIVSSEGANQSATGTCVDQAGNRASDTQSSINIDRTAPTLAPVVNPNPVLLNGSATVTSGAADALSGLASQSCGSVNTGSVGTQTVPCTATDQAGNSATASASYSVAYQWSGFLQPVDNLPTINSVKAGSAVPVKFSLGGNQGLNIFAPGYPVSQQISCSTSAPTDDIEQTVTAGSSSLSYDAATGQYSYVWKTDKAWAGQCRQLIVRLVDGTDHVATFRFK